MLTTRNCVRLFPLARLAAGLALTVTAGLPAACKPDLGAPISLANVPRILAMRGNPPEGPEGAAVTFDLLAVDGTQAIAAPPALWAICTEPRPPAETNSISAACLRALPRRQR